MSRQYKYDCLENEVSPMNKYGYKFLSFKGKLHYLSFSITEINKYRYYGEKKESEQKLVQSSL